MLYYLYMASIVGKKQGGHTYYYLVESARVGGRPRIVSQRYLGSADQIALRLSETGPGEPDRTRHLACGNLAAVWAMLERLSVAEIVDEVVGQRRSDAAGSVGTYFPLALANRGAAPGSKLASSDWGGPDRAEERGKDGGHVRHQLLRARARHHQLRHLHRLGQRPGADRPARPRQAEEERSSSRRSRARGLDRLRRAARQSRLSGEPSRCDPVRRRGRRT